MPDPAEEVSRQRALLRSTSAIRPRRTARVRGAPLGRAVAAHRRQRVHERDERRGHARSARPGALDPDRLARLRRRRARLGGDGGDRRGNRRSGPGHTLQQGSDRPEPRGRDRGGNPRRARPGREEGPAAHADRRHALFLLVSRRRSEGQRSPRAHRSARGRGVAESVRAASRPGARQARAGSAGASAVRIAAP